ncbi:MAG TPA: class I SAM-dependent methyltransferase [Blastocatellia bacterium]|nr:class I SAM-dependent methyltransferase [Blastocatellia bacterium]
MRSCDISPTETLETSFRDPSGRVIVSGDRVIRLVNKEGADDLVAFLDSPAAQKYVAGGQVVGTRFLERDALEELGFDISSEDLPDAAAEGIVVEHERIPFRSYPYEWPPEMLHAAGVLTLELSERIFDDGLGLKDATPYNILYRGSTPVFVDVLSFERRDPADPIWLPYAQFVRTFLLPLLVNKHFGVPIAQIFSGRRDGLEPEEVYRLAGPIKRLTPAFFSLVAVATWLGKGDPDKSEIYKKKVLRNSEQAKYILRALIRRSKRALNRLEPKCTMASNWSEYMRSNNYSEAHFHAKDQFVEAMFSEFAPKRVLDVGCNTGHFSVSAANCGARVVAIDTDPVVVGKLWRRARQEKLDILPLVANLSAPTPAMGWRNRECPSFLERTRGRFDCVLMLAVIHHLLITERVPLSEIIDLAAELTTDLCVMEFIGPEDSMFKRLVRGREHLFAELTEPAFEAACRRHFDIVRTQHVEGTERWLYLLSKRTAWDVS